MPKLSSSQPFYTYVEPTYFEHFHIPLDQKPFYFC